MSMGPDSSSNLFRSADPATWTGDAACFLPRPAPPPAIAGTTPRPGAAGSWLKAAAPARLRLAAAAPGPEGTAGAPAATLLELSLPRRPLLRLDLSGRGWPRARLLQEAGVLVIPAGAAAFAFRFYDQQEAAAFRHCLGAHRAAALSARQQRAQQQRAFLSDPAFGSYVERVEALWDEVEAGLGLGGPGAGSAGGGG
ncbi:MAG: hypothetical protein J3K34DRAFT_524235 [Monoraphidium minutum]|nr:MAG: hypothetical protein J3K34DRAFT_524235 [Monoraphidium minutum]